MGRCKQTHERGCSTPVQRRSTRHILLAKPPKLPAQLPPGGLSTHRVCGLLHTKLAAVAFLPFILRRVDRTLLSSVVPQCGLQWRRADGNSCIMCTKVQAARSRADTRCAAPKGTRCLCRLPLGHGGASQLLPCGL